MGVDDDHDWSHRGRHRDLVGAHGRLGKVPQRCRRIVPLDEVADQGSRVLHAMLPLHAPSPLRRIQVVARKDEHRDAVTVRVVDGHRRVLEPDRPMTQRGHRLAFDLVVAMGHRDGRFLVAAGKELGRLVVAVVEDRLVDAAEARAGVRRNVFEVERLEDVQHEVAARPAGRTRLDLDHRVDLADPHRRRGGPGPLGWRGLRYRGGCGVRSRVRHQRRGAGHGGTFQKAPAIDGRFPGHGAPLLIRRAVYPNRYPVAAGPGGTIDSVQH